MSEKSGVVKLDNQNYEVWCVLMEALLTRKGIQDVGMGITPPPNTGPNSSAGKAWTRKNAEARAEMILHVEVDQLAHMTSTVASEVWDELERVHRARGLATRLALRRTFLTMKKKSTQQMSQWIADVRALAFRLRGIGVNTDDEDLILVLTMGLPPAYDTFVVSLDATPSNQLLLDDVIARLLNEESRHIHSIESVPEAPKAAASFARAPSTRSDATRPPGLAHITCFTCGIKGHFQANCPTRSEPKRASDADSAATAAPDELYAAHAAFVAEEDDAGDHLW